jgi:hypothetical protein
MNPVEELYHAVLQKLIITALGLLTVSVLLTSCMTPYETCAAYNAVEVESEPAPETVEVKP